ncbi:MAG: lysophospholipid acyltransferase family protein [Jatrophihabitans sp.]|uniref:lysophospholipid acyltransferase family protein n=1 Tax=Jatrophihabitans sp. TaxID=1932789 RepID=UPI003F81649D
MPRRKLRRRGHGEKLGFGWRFAWFVLYYPVSGLFKIRWRNIERVPATGGVIVVVNHVSHVDPFIVSKFILDAARVPRFLAKEAIFEVPVVGWGMRKMGHIPVRRDTADAALALQSAVEKLRSGALVVLHPEGTVTRDPDGWPMSAKTGTARLWLLAPEVPVIPVAQWGVQSRWDFYTRTIKPFPRARHTLSVGEPIDLSRFRGAEPTPAVLREMTDVIMKRLREDVAELRGEPAPDGELFVWHRPRPSAAGSSDAA